MSRRVKELIVSDLERRFRDLDDAIIIGCDGLTAEESGAFRNAIREAGATVGVVKNTLARRVFSDRGLSFDDSCFQGPTAVVYGNDDAVSASKVVAEWRKKNKKTLPLKGGVLAGQALTGTEAERLTDMPSVLEIKQMVVSAVAGPLTSLVGITNNILGGVSGVLQAIVDKKNEEGA